MSSPSKAERATALHGRRWAEALAQPARGMEESRSSTLTITQKHRDGRTDLRVGAESPAASGGSASAKEIGRGRVKGLGWFPFPILHIFGGLKIPLESAGYGYAVRAFFYCWKCCCSCTELLSFSTFFSPLRWKCTSKRMYYLQTCIKARSSHG